VGTVRAREPFLTWRRRYRRPVPPWLARLLRLVTVVPALAVGGWLLHQGWVGPLDNIVGYRDSPVWVYLLVGSVYVLPGLLLIGYALRTLVRGGT
jgi:hypothetical protein